MTEWCRWSLTRSPLRFRQAAPWSWPVRCVHGRILRPLCARTAGCVCAHLMRMQRMIPTKRVGCRSGPGPALIAGVSSLRWEVGAGRLIKHLWELEARPRRASRSRVGGSWGTSDAACLPMDRVIDSQSESDRPQCSSMQYQVALGP